MVTVDIYKHTAPMIVFIGKQITTHSCLFIREYVPRVVSMVLIVISCKDTATNLVAFFFL
jgi:hypothetical protein